MSAVSPCPDVDGDRFACTDATADPSTIGVIRDEFARWLRCGAALDETRACDMVLALNEALSNSAEFAYVEGRDGTVDVEAVRDLNRHVLSVTVTDRGRWRENNPLNRQRRRGRGIPLMRTLADSVIIDTSGLGTCVRLRFDDVAVEFPAR
jgi:anti-sigma regulatory factor (Ser/Thr protein kinase)